MTQEEEDLDADRASAWVDEQRDRESEAAIERRERRTAKRLAELRASLEARGYDIEELERDNPYNGGLDADN